MCACNLIRHRDPQIVARLNTAGINQDPPGINPLIRQTDQWEAGSVRGGRTERLMSGQCKTRSMRCREGEGSWWHYSTLITIRRTHFNFYGCLRLKRWHDSFTGTWWSVHLCSLLPRAPNCLQMSLQTSDFFSAKWSHSVKRWRSRRLIRLINLLTANKKRLYSNNAGIQASPGTLSLTGIEKKEVAQIVGFGKERSI